jgi:two-component system chemotaxis sensor kinase CheA
LDLLEQLFLRLEENDSGVIDAIFRVAHTLKGSAACVGLKDVADFAHKMETLLDNIRKGQVVASESICNLLLQSGDILRALIRGVEEGLENYTPPEYASVVQKLECASSQGSILAGDTVNGCNKLLVRVELDRESEMRAARAFVILKRLEEFGRLTYSKPAETELVTGQVVPDSLWAVIEGELEEGILYDCVAGYPDVMDVDVRYMVEIREADWIRYAEQAYILEAQGKRIAVHFVPGVWRLDVKALKFLADALRRGWLLNSTDDIISRVLSRMSLK